MGPDSSLTPDLIQAQSFTTAFRGYDPNEVRSFLARVATEVRAWRERAEQLESAWHSAEERAARPPVLDEDTLMAAVGEETASILRSARSAAADMRAKAAEEAERTLSQARAEVARMGEEAASALEKAITEADAAAAKLLADARADVGEMLERARAEAAEALDKSRTEAEALRAQAEKERQLTIDGATSTRDRILEDLARRKRVATVQIEQLRAGRERLIESYAVVRRTLEEAQTELGRADAEARAAADAVGRRLRDETNFDGPLDDDLLTSSPLAGGRPGGETEVDPDAPAPVEAAEAVEAVEAVESVEAGDGADGADVVEAVEGADGAEAAEADQAQAAEADQAEDVEVEDSEPAAGDDDAESPVAGAVGGEPADESGEATGSAVDELFARIRATRADRAAAPGSEAGAVAADDGRAAGEASPAAEAEAEAPAPAPAATGGGDGGRKPAKGAGRSRAARSAAAPEEEPAVPVPAALAEAVGASEAEAVKTAEGVASGGDTAGAESETDAGDEDDEERLSDADESLLQQRESAVVDLEVTLTRRLKRALQDEQNDVLDRLRNLKGRPSVEALLPASDAQIDRFAAAARPLLEQAAAAGAEFAAKTLGSSDAAATADVADLAGEAGSGIVGPLRRRLEQAIAVDDEQAVMVESLGAAYREWKTQRIERLAGDVLAAAFSRGTWEATPEGAQLRWIVEDIDGLCPDCDDDALAGELPKGEMFPTGQHHPPAHSGCRCLLVPVPPAG